MTTSTTLFVAGDVMTGRGIDQILPDPVEPTLYEPYVRDARDYVELAERESGEVSAPVDPAYIWGEGLAVLDEVQPDVRLINLETSITRSEEHWPSKGIHYRMSPENALALEPADLDVCTLANNHVLDWGYPGLDETFETLESRQIAYVGAGRDRAGARRPVAVDLAGGRRALIFGLCAEDSGIPRRWAAGPDRPGVHLIDDFSPSTVEAFGELVERHTRPADLVVASIHWGGNWGWSVPERHIDFAHGLVDEAGVDLVHGHSSHHVKPFEIYRDKLILYGCGDLLTDYEGIAGHEEYRGDVGVMYFPRLEAETGRLLELEMWPTRVRRMQLTRAPNEDVDWVIDVLERHGSRFDLAVERCGQHRLVA